MVIPIKQIKLHELSMSLNNPFSTSFGTVTERPFYLIEIIDADNNHGYGESVAFSVPWYTEETVQTNFHIMTDFLIPMLQANEIQHPHEVSALFQAIKRNNMAKAALETAIWDLYAKRMNRPLYEVLGGNKRTIDVGISIGIQPSVDQLLDHIRRAMDIGYKRVKLKIKPGHDMTVLEKVRQHFPNLPILADANSAYTLQDIDHLRQLDAFNLMMIEQPLGHDDIIDHATLQAALQTPICLDESIHSLDDARHAIELGSCRVINIKIGRVGGLTEAKRIHDYCAAHHIPVWCGGMLEAGIGRAHNIALTTLTNFTLPGDTAGSAHYWQEDIIDPEVIVENGEITVPTGLGIGYDIKPSAINRYKKTTHTFSF